MLLPLSGGAPERIGPYEILARLGAGGMGEVFLGRTPGDTAGTHDGTYVAVKTVRRDVVAEPAFRDRFRREIKVASLVASPYAPAPLGGDPDAEVPWLATAYVPGPSLSQAVRRDGPLPVPAVRALGAALARALGDLHAVGVLHRDLKPGNVMLAVDGPRVIDFGIARSSGATTMTATGVMVGTPSFMSPEHVAGARHVSGASDVFCLGSVLCYAATGEDPFGDGPLAAVLYRVSQAEADLTRVPDELRDVIASCLAADPAARPTPQRLAELLGGAGQKAAWPPGVHAHIGEYGRELAQLIASGAALREVAAAPVAPDQLPTMPPVAPEAPDTPAAPRKRRRALLAAVVALALVAGGVGTYLLWPEGTKKPTGGTAAPPGPGPTIPGVDLKGLADSSGIVPQYPNQRPKGWQPWTAKLSAPALGCAAGTTVLVCRTTSGVYEALDPADGRKLWSADTKTKATPDRTTISPSGASFVAGGATRPTVHGDAVVFYAGGKLQVRDARTGNVRWEKTVGGVGDFGTRPLVGDGTVFAPADAGQKRGGLTAYALADGKALWTKSLSNTELSRAEERPFEQVAFANGQVYALSDAGLVAYEARTGEARGQVDQDAANCWTVKVVGKAAYCTDVDSRGTGELHALDSATLASRASVPAPAKGLRPDVITPTALVSFDGGLKVHDPRDGKQLKSYTAKPAPKGLGQGWSAPLVAGDQIVYADFSSLYTVRLGKDGEPGELRTTALPGAPGPRAREKDFDLDWGVLVDKQIRDPQVLPIGGIAHVVFDKGVVSSVELPK